MLRHQADGKKIQLFRDARGWTQEHLSFISGYSVKTIRKAESDGRLKRQTLQDIAMALGVGLDDIVVNYNEVLAPRLEDVNKQIVMNTLAAFPQQDLKVLMDRIHPDARFEHPGPPVIPETGEFHGHKQVRQYFQRAFSSLPLDELIDQRLVAEGNYVDWHYKARYRSPHNGQTIDYLGCFHFQLDRGKILHFRQCQDYSGLLAFYENNGWPSWRR